MNIPFRMDRARSGMIVGRVDLEDLASLSEPKRLIDGSMIVSGRAARTGDLKYPWGNERRDSAELESIARQLQDQALLVGHPEKLMRYGGSMPIAGRVRRADVRGNHAIVELHLNATGQNALADGRDELSLGYETKIVYRNNVAWQTETRVDHLAMVHVSRCGPSCGIRVDCDGDHSCACDDIEEKFEAPIEARVASLLGIMRSRK